LKPRSKEEASRLVRDFKPAAEETKSVELTLALLECTQDPFSRDQFEPGHITCSALVLHPGGGRVLLMHHHRHKRWLLPGGHVEAEDAALADTACRETLEETLVAAAASDPVVLAGIDVHGIPARKREPFHLHHDLLFLLRAESGEFSVTREAPQVVWSAFEELQRYGSPANIVRAAARVLGR
jgi:8-oxo-dGTP pyrophosphatase MutT (NUDIX family)